MLSKAQLHKIRQTVSVADDRLPALFAALGDASRFRIFSLLLQRNDLCVTEVARIFKVSVPAASQQLRVLEAGGLVRKERDGQMICYQVRRQDPVVRAVGRLLQQR